jgi:protein-disulfide isomerase
VAPKLARLVQRDVRIRFIYKEWPILGGSSELAARAALAVHRQGKYEAFHRRMMAVTGLPTMGLIRSVADELGLDWTRLQQDMADPRIGDALARTKRLAKRIGIVGTPAFVAGETIVQGAVDPEQLLSLAEDAAMRPDLGVKTPDTPSAR